MKNIKTQSRYNSSLPVAPDSYRDCLLLTTYRLLLPIAIGISSCGSDQNELTPEAAPNHTLVELSDAQLNHAGIKTGRIEQRSLSSILKASGRIDVPPQNMVSISIPLGGYLKSTKLLAGMHITKGEVLAVMEDQQYITLQQDYLMAKEKLLFLKEEFYRQQELNQSKAASDKVFRQAQVEFSTQKILIKSLSEKLKLIGIQPDSLTENNLSRSINITSPIDGYVSHVNMNIGKYANPSDILFELVNPTDIHLAVTIFENDISKLFIGQKLVACANANPSKKYPCEIILIGKDLSHDGSAEVHCHFEQYDKSLIPGMFMNAEVALAANPAFVIPNEGLVSFKGKQYVFLQTEPKLFKLQEVTTQNNENGFTQIIFSDTVGRKNQTFVTSGAYTLLMKMKNTQEE
jgi:membrane fusion protein, heavy metal efflux system